MEPMEEMEEARHYLDAAAQLRMRPFAQYGTMGTGLEEFERRDREVLQLHIRAMVAAAAVIQQGLERLLDQGDEPVA